uniref:Uncharacterized protein n=1 Tax=Panagrolaimus sp. PS1159 TaxID=55785 RepID=A0AC35F0K5_9BILA
MQYYGKGYGNGENPNYDNVENAQYPEENYYPNDEPINGEEYPNVEYPENIYPDDQSQYPEYPNNEDETIGDDSLYPEYPNYPQTEKYTDYPNEDYQYPEYSSYPGNVPNMYPQESNYLLKQILQTQKNGNKKGKSDSSNENIEVKDLLPILREIVNGKEPDFGKIASKLGQNG